MWCELLTSSSTGPPMGGPSSCSTSSTSSPGSSWPSRSTAPSTQTPSWPAWRRSALSGRHRSTCASTTGPSSSPMPLPTCVGSTMPGHCSWTLGHHGGTPGSSHWPVHPGRASERPALRSPARGEGLTEDRRNGYSSSRRHSGIGRMTPAAFTEAWIVRNQRQLA